MLVKEVPINHNILEWARIEANLSPQRAADKARIKDIKARGEKEALSPIERLQRWEKGIDTPSFSQLEKLAKAYRRPVLTFFLPQPPIKQTRLKDFRTIGNKSFDSDDFSPEFSALLRQIEALQTSLHDLVIDAGNSPINIVGSLNFDFTPDQITQKMRSMLEYSFDSQRSAKGFDDVFSNIRSKIEQQGVFVLLVGNLGSYHTDIQPDVFRGLAISDNRAPFIVINPNDAKPARIFSLIHEFCHVLRGETGVSNWSSLYNSDKNAPFQNEAFCDQVAAEFLAPTNDLLDEWKHKVSVHSPEESIEIIAKSFNISRMVIARRLLEFGKINGGFYWDYFDTIQEEWRAQKNQNKVTKDLKIPYKVRIRSKFGNRLVDTIIGATRDGKISELSASRMLDVRMGSLTKIV